MLNLKVLFQQQMSKVFLLGIGYIQEPKQGSSASSIHQAPAHTLGFACPPSMTRGSGTGCWSESPLVAEGHCGVDCCCEPGSMPRHLLLSLRIAYWPKAKQNASSSAHMAI